MPGFDNFYMKNYLKHKNQRDLDLVRVSQCQVVKFLICIRKEQNSGCSKIRNKKIGVFGVIF